MGVNHRIINTDQKTLLVLHRCVAVILLFVVTVI